MAAVAWPLKRASGSSLRACRCQSDKAIRTGQVDGHAQDVQPVKSPAPVAPEDIPTSLGPVCPSAAMKYAVALLAVSAVALTLIIVHGVVQEMKLRQLKTRTANTEKAVESKEQIIVSTKSQLAQLRIAMETERTKAKELARRHEEVENSKRESEAKLQTCNSEKARLGNGRPLLLASVHISRTSCPTVGSSPVQTLTLALLLLFSALIRKLW